MTKEERDRFLLFDSELFGSDINWPVWCEMSDWGKFGFLWDRAKKKEWWIDFLAIHGDALGQERFTFLILCDYINPNHFADALAEFLMQRKDESHAALPRPIPQRNWIV